MEMLGVAMESHYTDLPTPKIEEILEPTIKDHALAVAANDNFGPRQAEFNELRNLAKMTCAHNHYLMINISVIPAEPDNIAQVENSKNVHNNDNNYDTSLPSCQQLNSATSDNDSTYTHDAVDDSNQDVLLYDSDKDDHEEDSNENDQGEDEGDNRTLPGVWRSGRDQKKSTYLNEFMHFSIVAENVEKPVAIHKDKMHALGLSWCKWVWKKGWNNLERELKKEH